MAISVCAKIAQVKRKGDNMNKTAIQVKKEILNSMNKRISYKRLFDIYNSYSFYCKEFTVDRSVGYVKEEKIYANQTELIYLTFVSNSKVPDIWIVCDTFYYIKGYYISN